MGVFDGWGSGQATNGVPLQNPQATSGAPGFNFGSWGNLPPNLAGGIQQFMAARSKAPGMGGMFGASPGAPSAPPQGMAGTMTPSGVPAMPQQSAPPVAANSAMPAGQATAAGTVPTPQGSAPGMVQPQPSPGMAGGFTSGMRPFLGG